MSNYTQNVNFTAKDSLTTGDPAKKIKGSEFDAELSEISTAIASKEDTANKGAANGYCGLDAGGLVLDSDLSSNIPRLNSATNAFANAVTIGTSLTVGTTLGVTGAATFGSTVGVTGTLTGAAGSFTSLTVGGNNVLTTASSIAEASITDGSVLARIAANETISGSWTFSTAVTVPAATVTAHQASLTIAETQISDGSILARVAASETISGAWTFTGAGTITRSGQGRYVYLNGTGNTGGAITLSTSAASGTPANGDIWLQYTA